VALPAVSYDRLKDLVAASDGRIPDPFAQPAKSAEEKSGGQDGSADETLESDAADSSSTDAADKPDTSTDD
jgi:hypothetical protein